jgi:hypothetical protein
MNAKKIGGPSSQAASTETFATAMLKSHFGQEQSGSGPLSLPFPTNKTRLAKKGSARKAYSYEPLAITFTLCGFTYRQIAREGAWAVYEQRWHGSENVCYEVIRIRRVEATTFPGGRSYPAREVYPSSEQWRQHGWTVLTRDAAFGKLSEIRKTVTR